LHAGVDIEDHILNKFAIIVCVCTLFIIIVIVGGIVITLIGIKKTGENDSMDICFE
jgi:hypothetical protein